VHELSQERRKMLKTMLGALALCAAVLWGQAASAQELSDFCQGVYREYAAHVGPKAFVTTNGGGACWWWYAGALPVAENNALKACHDANGDNCHIYNEAAGQAASAGDVVPIRILSAATQDDEYLNIEHGTVEISPIQQGWSSAKWVLEDTGIPGPGGYNYTRFRSYWKPDQYLNIEHGSVESSPIEQGWWSAIWAPVNIKDANGKTTNGFMFENRWKPGQFLLVDGQGHIGIGPDDTNSYADAWVLQQIDDGNAPAQARQ
jgi:hypothetical protein